MLLLMLLLLLHCVTACATPTYSVAVVEPLGGRIGALATGELVLPSLLKGGGLLQLWQMLLVLLHVLLL